MKISKEKAHAAAVKIAAPMMAKIKEHDEKINSDVTKMYESKVPKDVMECFKKHPSFFSTESSEFIGRIGSEYVYARFGRQIPDIGEGKFTQKERDTMLSLVNTKETLKEKYDRAVLDIENTILALGTPKRVETEFPEALPFLDYPTTSTAVMLNIAPIRKLACALIPNCGDKKKTA
jgi:hypothetical protein